VNTNLLIKIRNIRTQHLSCNVKSETDQTLTQSQAAPSAGVHKNKNNTKNTSNKYVEFLISFFQILLELSPVIWSFDKSASGEDVEEEREKKIRGTSQG